MRKKENVPFTATNSSGTISHLLFFVFFCYSLVLRPTTPTRNKEKNATKNYLELPMKRAFGFSEICLSNFFVVETKKKRMGER
jgi:hypothetical protein